MTWKMKLVSLGIVPDHIGFTADRYCRPRWSHWAIGDIVPLTILLCDTRNETASFFIIQHRKTNWCRWGSIPIVLNGNATAPIRFHWAVVGVVALIILLPNTRNETASIFLKYNMENYIDVGRDRSQSYWIFCWPRFRWAIRFVVNYRLTKNL